MNRSRYRLECELWLPVPIERVWEFGSNPKNLAGISPKHLGVRIPNPPACENGALVVIEMAPWGISLPLKWHSRLSHVQPTGPKRLFVDTQESGPFAYWRHEHHFESGESEVTAHSNGQKVKMREAGTWIRDFVEYEVPFGPAGLLAHKLFGRAQLEAMFAYRTKMFRSVFLS